MSSKFKIPAEFSVTNGYVGYVIGQWLKDKAGFNLSLNLSTTQLDDNSGFFDGTPVVIHASGSTAGWQRKGVVTPHFNTLKEFQRHVKIPEISVRLNSEYMAVFNPGDTEVTVGCQKIPTYAILALADKIRENQ